MNQPGRLLSLFTAIRSSASSADDTSLDDATSITGSLAVDEILRTLSHTELARLLTHVRDWNTTARTSGIAQTVLHAVLKLRTPDDIMQAFEPKTLPRDEEESGDSPDAGPIIVSRPKIAPAMTLREFIDGMLPYTERHLARADKLVQDSFVVDYILGEMDMGLLVDDMMDVDVAA